MKADRELLELAAKAAGLPECGWMGPAFVYVKDNEFVDWAPLADDGDALRLAATMEFELSLGQCGAMVYMKRGPNVEELDEVDYMRATRRAIVRAAAAIGEAM